MSEFKRIKSDGSETLDLALIDDAGRQVVVPQNITTKFREAFESYTPNGDRWAESRASGDIVMVDGNAVGASYLVISKDPLVAGTETTVTTQMSMPMPIELAMGLHMSQRALGQEFSVEVVSDETSVPTIPDIAISSISQATTTLTVNTVAAHGLKPGARIGVFGSPDSRANYPALVVASIPSPTQFTATAGPGGNIASLTYGPVNGGFVYIRSSTGFAKNAVSMIFENATATNASFYVKTEAGDVHPAGGVLVANHSVATGSTASIQGVNAAYTYAFQPTTEFRLALMGDRLQWSDVGVDSTGASTNRILRTQVAPDPSKNYKLRLRFTNNKALPVPVAQIVSAVKTGTTTATVTTDIPHGLTTTDLVQLVGIRDQTNFANQTTGNAVVSVINATQFTIVIGTAVTATSFGGFVARVQGSTAVQGLISQVVQSATVASGILTLVGSANWTTALIGDLVNTVGVRDNATGAAMALDGAWRVRNVSLTSLELEPVGTTPVPANLATTNCGGAILRRTDARISFLRMFEFKRERVEMLARPSGDEAASAPVRIQGTPSVSATSTPVTPTTATLNSAATANPVSVKTTAGNVLSLVASNTGAADRFIKLYNKASAPTVGTDIPILTLRIPTGDAREYSFGALGIRFASGIAYAVTALAADSDTTAIGAGEVKLALSYL